MTVVLTALLVLGCLAAGLDVYGRRPPPSGSWDAIVVAGCRVTPAGRASPTLARRVRLAVSLHQQGLAPVIVMTGGVGDHPPAEAQAAAAVARSLGVSADAILLESQSTSTEENARYARSVFGDGRVLVVTDTYHVFRAERVFRRHFSKAQGVGSRGAVSVRIKGAMRELAALVIYGLRGQLVSFR